MIYFETLRLITPIFRIYSQTIFSCLSFFYSSLITIYYLCTFMLFLKSKLNKLQTIFEMNKINIVLFLLKFIMLQHAAKWPVYSSLISCQSLNTYFIVLFHFIVQKYPFSHNLLHLKCYLGLLLVLNDHNIILQI